MTSYLKRYKLKLTALGPVFIGNGMIMAKKDYIFVPDQKRIYIPHFETMISFFEERGLLLAYEEFLSHSKRTFYQWLVEQNVTANEIFSFSRYSISVVGSLEKDINKGEVFTCLKDAYGCPYIPGSSLKGALRTALLGKEMLNHPDKFEKIRENIKNARITNGRKCLDEEGEQLQNIRFRVLKRFGETEELIHQNDKIKNCMSAIRISDSKPISTEELIIVRKIDVGLDGREKRVSVFRECIRPGTVIEFDLTVDSTIWDISPAEIMEAIKTETDFRIENIESLFETKNMSEPYAISLGGGAGFWSKTVIYPLLGKNIKTVRVVSSVFFQLLGKETAVKHKHNKNPGRGIAPHTIKRAYYQGQRLPMGLCKVVIEDIG